MNRLSIFFVASAMVFAAGCQKGLEENNLPETPGEVPGEASEVVLTANLPQTKTTLEEGYKVTWNKNDELAVFNAPAGTEGYSGNLRFRIDENAEGKFSAVEGIEVPFEDGVNYDWYVCSPWRKDELHSPKGQSSEDGYFPIGAQTQTGYNNSAHIAAADIMVGKALDTRTPSVALKHLGVLHKFTVTNNSDKPTVITKLTFNGGDNKIFGTFWIDITADNPAIDVTKANGSFNERALTVKDGTELPVGESADFYIITAPFTLNEGETFKVTIETSTGTQVVEKTASKDIDFAAGTYNTAGLVYDFAFADHLYFETFNTSTSLTDVTSTNGNILATRWKSYDKAGLTVYDGNTNSIVYSNASESTISRYSNSALKGMDDLYAYIGQDGTFTVEGIKLYGHKKLNLSFKQTYKNSILKAEYSIDNGTNWDEIGTYTNPNAATCEERSTNFEISDATVIWLRFSGNASSKPRIDNIKLTWQAEQ